MFNGFDDDDSDGTITYPVYCDNYGGVSSCASVYNDRYEWLSTHYFDSSFLSMDENSSLIAAFPSVLRNAIGRKKVNYYATVYHDAAGQSAGSANDGY